MTPSPLILLVLALAVLRTWRLLSVDTLPFLVAFRTWLVGSHLHTSGIVTFDRPLLREWLECPWCSGLWVSAAWYAAWLEWPSATLYAAVPLAVSAVVGIAASLLPD